MAPPVKQRAPKGRSERPQKAISDPRFSNIETDPRFRLPSKKHTQVKLDKRFSRVLKDDDFSNKASVDRYGRKIAKTDGKKELERFYRLEEEDEDTSESESGSESGSESDSADDDDEVQKELARIDRKYDPAREGGFSSSSEDDSSEDEEEEEFDEDGAEPDEAEVPMGDVTSRIALVNLDWDNIRAIDIMAVANSFVPADSRILNVTIYPSEFGKERIAREEKEGPPKEIFASGTSTSKTAFNEEDDEVDDDEDASSASDSDSDVENEKYKKQILSQSASKGEEFDPTALRSYQLDRLRYYYAILTCSSASAAQHLYDAMDGREYLSSANFFDMRFVPDDTPFDADEARDACDAVPDGYRPNEFTTDALTHSRVRLTWDADDATRKEVQKRAFSRAEMDENDLMAYIGSEESSDEDEGDGGENDRASKLRAALGLSAEKPSSSKKNGRKDAGPVGDMQITFTPGLSAKNGSDTKGTGVFGKTGVAAREETTIEKYVRKEKERKARRKERSQAARDGRDPDAMDASNSEEEDLTSGSDSDDDEDAAIDSNEAASDDFSGFDDSDGESDASSARGVAGPPASKDPFDDPFFANPDAANKAAKQKARAEKKDAAKKARQLDPDERARLELLMLDESGERGLDHFDMNAIAKAEKDKARKKKKGKKGGEKEQRVDLQEGFELDVKDPRFARLYESHEFAIDPTNPRYQATEGMKALLEEGRRRRKEKGSKRGADDDLDGGETVEKKRRRTIDEPKGGDADDLKRLVDRVKGRSKR